MRTEHLDNKINELETLRSRGELTYMGGEMLSEFNEIKQALTIPVVIVPKGTLFCGECGNKRELIVETDLNSGRTCKSRLCKAK